MTVFPRIMVNLATGLVMTLCLAGAVFSGTQAPPQTPGGVLLFVSDRGGDWDIYSILPDGSELTRLTRDVGMNSGATLSPDNKRIAFNSDRSGNMQIWAMDADGSTPVQLTDNPEGGNQHPQWSPDGQWIVFNSWRNEGEASSDIWLMAADGSKERRLTSGEEMEEYPEWSPSGERILFTVGNAALFTMAADGTDRRRVTEDHFFTAGDDWG